MVLLWYYKLTHSDVNNRKKREEYFMKRLKKGLAALIAALLAASSLMTALPAVSYTHLPHRRTVPLYPR